MENPPDKPQLTAKHRKCSFCEEWHETENPYVGHLLEHMVRLTEQMLKDSDKRFAKLDKKLTKIFKGMY